MSTQMRMTKWIGLAAGLIVMTSSPMSFADGKAEANTVSVAGDSTGGGNGTGSRQEQIRKLRADVGPKLHIGSMVAGSQQPQIDEWCDRVTRFLKTQRKRASNQIKEGNREGTIQILRDALAVAEDSIQFDGRQHSPITHRMLRRGLEMANALDGLFAENDVDGRGLQTEAMFLMSYVGFVIETIRELDRPLYVPYIFNKRSPKDAMEQLEKRYLQYAQDQLSYVNGKFTRNVVRDGAFVGLPVGEPQAYLVLASMIAHSVAEELDSPNSLSAYANSCAIGDLREISANLTDYINSGDRTVYRYDAEAVDTVREELAQISGRVAGTVCAD